VATLASSREGDSPYEVTIVPRLQRVVLLASALVSAWTAGYQGLYGSRGFALFSCGLLAVVGAVAATSRRSRSPRAVSHAILGLLFATTGSIAAATGGAWPGGLFMLPIVPTVAILLLGRRAGAIWGALVIASTLGLALASASGMRFPVAVDPIDAQAATFRISIILSLVLAATATAYDRFREQQEASLRRANESLAEGEERFRSIAEFATDMILEFDASGRMLFANRIASELLGPAAISPAALTTLSFVHEDDSPRLRDFVASLLDKGFARAEPVRVRGVNGDWRWLEIAARVFTRASGAQRTVAVARDVTERRALERELVRREALAAVGSITAGMAHQVSNPLASILTTAQLAQRESERGGSVQDLLVHIEREAHRAGALTRDLLRFSRGDATERRLESINDLARRTVEATRRFARDHDATVELVLDDVDVELALSPIAIEQAVVNLIHNGIEAASGRRAIVTVTTVSTPDSARIVVSDNGRGLSRDELALIFEPFYTTREGRGGSGLGLSVARRAVEDHGGTLTAQPLAGSGARFEIRIPIAAPAESPRARDGASS